MAGNTKFELNILAALNAIRERTPAYIETIQLGIAGAVVDFGAGASRAVAAPTGYKGIVKGVSLVRNAETFTAGARVDVGTASDTDAYYVGGNIPTGTAAQHPAGTSRGFIPGGQDFVVTMVPVTALDTGQAATAITIAWYQE
jgi:hypothetical protein